MSFRLTLLSISLFTLVACTQGGGKVELKSDEQKLSYAIGQQIGAGIKAQNMKVDVDAMAASIRDVMSGAPSRLTPEEMQTAMMKAQQSAHAARAGEGAANKAKADKFLAENKAKKGVKTTASGLQYEVITEGKGKSPKETDTVKVHYRGTLLDGTEFDSSYKRNEPAMFPVNRVIKGWTEALQLMKPGAKYKLTIPPDLAYGEQGRPSIPPNSLLQFEVELIAIQ